MCPGSAHTSTAAAAALPEFVPSKSVYLCWRLAPISAELFWTGRPSREMLLRNKRAACLRREFSRFLRLYSLPPCGFLLLPTAVTTVCWPQVAAAMAPDPLKKPSRGSARDLNLSNPFYRAQDCVTPPRAVIGRERGNVMTLRSESRCKQYSTVWGVKGCSRWRSVSAESFCGSLEVFSCHTETVQSHSYRT